jgi:antiviral helicase SKI2
MAFAMSDQNLIHLPEFQQRIAVLQHLKYIDENRTVMLKGRVACEV